MFKSDQCVLLLEALLLSRVCGFPGKRPNSQSEIPHESSNEGERRPLPLTRQLLQSLNWAYEGWSMGDCKSDHDCQVFSDHMICSQNVCTCDHGFVFIDYSLVHRGCYRKAPLFNHCVSNEQCTAMNRNTYCNPNNQCTCSSGYYFDGRECILRYDTNLKAQEVYRAAVVAAACFIVAVVGIFVACIVRRTFCRRDQNAQGLDSSRNSDIFSVSDEIAALRAVDKPPSYEEVLQIERTFYGIPPPEYSFLRRNNDQNNQENLPIPTQEPETACCQETPVDIHAVGVNECLECSGNVNPISSLAKNCHLCASIETPSAPCSSAYPDTARTPQDSPSSAPPYCCENPHGTHDNSSCNTLISQSPNSCVLKTRFTQISRLFSRKGDSLPPHLEAAAPPNSTWPRSSVHSVSTYVATMPLSPPWPVPLHANPTSVVHSAPLDPKSLIHTSSLPPSLVHPPLVQLDCAQSDLNEESGDITNENEHCVRSGSQEILMDVPCTCVSPPVYDNAAYIGDSMK